MKVKDIKALLEGEYVDCGKGMIVVDFEGDCFLALAYEDINNKTVEKTFSLNCHDTFEEALKEIEEFCIAFTSN